MLSVAPNGINALRVIGADAAVEAVGQRVPGVVMSDGNGNVLASFDGFPDIPVTITMSRASLFGAIANHAIGSGIKIEYGKRLVSAEDGPSGVEVTFDDGTSAAGGLLIGADGIHSTVRTIIDPNAPDPEYQGVLSFGGFSSASGVLAERGRMYFAFGRTFIGYWRLPDDRICWFASLSRPEPLGAAEVARVPASEWLTKLRELYVGHVPGEILLEHADPDALMAVGPMERMPSVPHWYRGRMVIVGDAAHAPSSSSGQGASLAIESAIELARCLRDLPNPAAFTAYEHVRRSRVEMIGAGAAATNKAKAGDKEAFAPPTPEQMFAPVHLHQINWNARVDPVSASQDVAA
jgi:2-polyprenyl-6-methoxyphenol hydroxylase-like FAD-dependent oxidoreductase